MLVSAVPPPDVGWAQYRAMGACALDLCAVADGVADGYVDFGDEQHGLWDYLGGWLVCREAGVDVVDAVRPRHAATPITTARRTPSRRGYGGVDGDADWPPAAECRLTAPFRRAHSSVG